MTDLNLKELTTLANSIKEPLDVLSKLALAREFYNKKARDDCYLQYDRLRSANHEAHERLRTAQRPEEKPELMEAVQATGAEFQAFRAKHPLIAFLIERRGH